MKIVIVFQNDMNGGVAFSATGRGMWTVKPNQLTDGVRFAAASNTARHPTDWPHTREVLVPVDHTDPDAYPFIRLDRRFG